MHATGGGGPAGYLNFNGQVRTEDSTETHCALGDSGAQDDTYLQSAIVATIIYQWQHPTP